MKQTGCETPRSGTRSAVIAAAAAAAVACAPLSGCMSVPASESEAIAVRLHATSTRVFRPGVTGRFAVTVTNEGSSPVAFTRLEVELVASPKGAPEERALARRWSYSLRQQVTLPGGKSLTVPVVPEPFEFDLGGLAPGVYSLRAKVFGNATSPPYDVRVERPDLSSRSRR